MTREETIMILKIIKSNYVNYFKEHDYETGTIMLDTWFSLFIDETYEVVLTALRKYLLTNKYPPQVCDIKELIFKSMNKDENSPMTAFNHVLKALRWDRDSATREFEKLPLEVRKTLRNVDSLCEWAVMNENDLQKYVYPRFRDEYNKVMRDKMLDFMSNENTMIENKSNTMIGDEF